MHINAPAVRRRPLSLTPLIDIIFLLLLFFMLSSTFVRFAEVEIAAETGAASSAAPAPNVMIRIDGATWQVNGRAFSTDDALAELGRLQEKGAERAVLIVRGEVSSQQLVTAVERIGYETSLSLTVAR